MSLQSIGCALVSCVWNWARIWPVVACRMVISLRPQGAIPPGFSPLLGGWVYCLAPKVFLALPGTCRLCPCARDCQKKALCHTCPFGGACNKSQYLTTTDINDITMPLDSSEGESFDDSDDTKINTRTALSKR